jgi:hypothetical protein
MMGYSPGDLRGVQYIYLVHLLQEQIYVTIWQGLFYDVQGVS